MSPEQIIMAALRIDWKDCESAARDVARWCSENMEGGRYKQCLHNNPEQTRDGLYLTELCACGAKRYGTPGNMALWIK